MLTAGFRPPEIAALNVRDVRDAGQHRADGLLVQVLVRGQRCLEGVTARPLGIGIGATGVEVVVCAGWAEAVTAVGP